MSPQRPRIAFIPPRYYATMLDALAELGHDADAVLAGAGLDAETIANEAALLTLDEVEALVGRAVALADTDALGLAAGSRLNLMSHGAVSVAALTAATAGDALKVIVELFPLVTPLFAITSETTLDQTRVGLEVRWPLPAEVERFHTAMLSGSVYAQLSTLLGGGVPEGVELDAAHPRPAGLPLWVDSIGVALRFDRPRYALRFPASWLDIALPFADARAHDGARERGQALLASRPDPQRISTLVAHLLRARGAPFLDMTRTARLLAISSRSLRRKLSDEGTSFQALLEDERARLADAWLADGRRSITTIGLELGYSDAANFSRAYKRVRGHSPSSVRSAREPK